MVPPILKFLCAVIRWYGLRLTQVHPNSIVFLAIVFKPLRALFRQYIHDRKSGRAPGTVSFCFRDGLIDTFIVVGKKQWDEHRHVWCYLHFREWGGCLRELDGLALRLKT